MTSEALVMNEHGVVIAADSIATKDCKTFRTRKIFELSKNQPVAIMVYGTSNICSVPIEMIISEYRRKIGEQTFDHLSDYAEDLIDFIKKLGSNIHSANPLITSEHMKFNFTKNVYTLIKTINSNVTKYIQSCKIKPNDNEMILNQYLEKVCRITSEKIDLEERKALLDQIKEMIQSPDDNIILEALDIWNDVKIREMILTLFANTIISHESMNNTGLVIVGYGSEDYTPSFAEYCIYDLFPNKLYYKKKEHIQINAELRSFIGTFAQDRAMKTFIKGIDPVILETIKKEIDRKMSAFLDIIDDNDSGEKHYSLLLEKEKLIKEIDNVIFQTVYREYDQPLNSTITLLSKKEMSTFAEFLVQTAVMNCHLSKEIESVGGPIDVVSICKDDGFIWMKGTNISMECNEINT